MRNNAWQGGSTFLQMEAAMMFVHCLTLYCHLIGEIWRYVPSPDRVIAAQYGEPMVASNDKPAQDSQQLQKTKWDKLEAFSISISDFTLALLARDEFGNIYPCGFIFSDVIDMLLTCLIMCREIPGTSI